MNVSRIIQTEGYRLEDLKPEHQELIRELRYLQKDFENFEYEHDEPSEILTDIVSQIADDVIEEVKIWLDLTIAEYQISMAESEVE